MTEKRKFTQHILPTSNHSKTKVEENSEPDCSTYFLEWGSSVPEPIDFEKYLLKNRSSILNDPHRELLIFPYEDLKSVKLHRVFRVSNAGTPAEALKPDAFSTNALARHCVSFYAGNEWICTYQPSLVYRGHFCKLPRNDAINVLIGSLVPHWFSIDHTKTTDSTADYDVSGSSTVSPLCVSSNPTISSASSRPWAAAMIASRTRHPAMTDSAPNESLLHSQQNGCDTNPHKRTESAKDGDKTSSDCLINGKLHVGDFESNSVPLYTSKREFYLECALAVCTRTEYLTNLRVRESMLASGLAAQKKSQPSIPPSGISLELYSFRVIQPDELLPTRLNSTDDCLHPGLYVIAPVSWKANQALRNNVIRLESVSSVHPIGDQWLKLDRIERVGPGKDISQAAELFIYFDNSVGGSATRQRWLELIQAITRPTSFHLGTSELQVTFSGSQAPLLDGGHRYGLTTATQISIDSTSIRNALQRFAQETEFFVSHQRQKNRLKLITVFPEVRLPYQKTIEAAKERTRWKASLAPLSVGISRTVTSDVQATKLRLMQGLSDTADCTTTPTPIIPPNVPLPFPDRTIHLCSRRFLATCLRLRSHLQCSIENAPHSDNAEPFFLTMFLVNANEGRRVSEEFYWNPNSAIVDNMIPSELYRNLAWSQVTSDTNPLPTDSAGFRAPTGLLHSRTRGPAPAPPTTQNLTASVDPDRVRHCRSAIFSVPSNLTTLAHIYLVVRVDKVLNGSVSTAVDKYTKGALNFGLSSSGGNTTTSDSKIASLLNRSMAVYCRHLGRYRMPFAWGARSVLSPMHRMCLFKMEPNRIAETAFMQQIQSLARLVDSSVPSQRSGVSASPEHAALMSLDPISRGAISSDAIERSLKIQAIPLILDLAISELISQPTDPGVQQITDLLNADLLPVTIGNFSDDTKYYIPATHPTLIPTELVREVEHFFDIRSIPAAAVNSDSATYSGSGDTDLSVFASHSSNVHRQFAGVSTGGSRSNRDSVISSSSVGSIHIGTDSINWTSAGPTANSNVSNQQSRNNSLERVNHRLTATSVELNTSHPSSVLTGIHTVPFTSFHHVLYVSPKSLNLAVKHNFSRARNLSCFIELRSDDSLDNTSALKVFYTRPSCRQGLFDTWCNTTVLYHETAPQFNEMFKLTLPLHITSTHHLLFRFLHVSVDAASGLTFRDKPSGKKPMESSTGYAWLPLLGPNGNINTGTFQLSIASEIQPGYLKLRSYSNRGLGHSLSTVGAAGDGGTSWLEGGKPLFTVQLDALSSIYTTVPVLARFFRACTELAGRILNSPIQHHSSGSSKTKTNRVTFLDDPVEGPRHVPERQCQLVSSSPAFTDCSRHLCSAIKGLWMIDQCALVHFLPPLLNQFMELILISANAGHRCSSHPGNLESNRNFVGTTSWMDLGRWADSSNSPNEILRTTMGTMVVLLSGVNASGSSAQTSVPGYNFDIKDMGVGKLHSDIRHHELLRNYVKFAFDSEGLTSRCIALHSSSEVVKDQTTKRSTETFSIPLHHALLRGLLLVLSDTHCTQHILTHLFNNLWFPLALITRSMVQWLYHTQKIKADRAGEGRFAAIFSDDLTLLIKLIGSYLNAAGSNQWLVKSLVSIRSTPGPSVSVTSLKSTATLSAISQSSVARLSVRSLPAKSLFNGPCSLDEVSNQQRRTGTSHGVAVDGHRSGTHRDGSVSRSALRNEAPTIQCDFCGIEVITSTAQFLCHMFNVMDRGFVMQRVRDLLVFLEILPRMSSEEIDRLNELRFQLLNVLSQHEFFVQLNLPSLGLYQASYRNPYDLCLTEQFRQEHFLVGAILAAVSCLLAGCVNTGSWAVGHTANNLHRQPLVLLRNLLAKHCLDPRYATSKPCQSRITALYLPLIRMVLEHSNVIGSPGGALQAAVMAAAARGEFGEYASEGSELRRRKRGTATSETATVSGAPISRPRSVISDLSLETLAVGAGHSGQQSDSGTSLSLSNHSGGSGGAGLGASSLGGGSSHTSSSTQSAAYLTEDGKVEKHILDQIAGLNTGGPLRRAQFRRNRLCNSSYAQSVSFNHSSYESAGVELQDAPSSHSGSTVTLTGFGSGEEDGRSGDSIDNLETASVAIHAQNEDDSTYISRTTQLRRNQRDKELSNIRMVDDAHDCSDANQDWATQVLSLVGVYNQSPVNRPNLSNVALVNPPNLSLKSDGVAVPAPESRSAGCFERPDGCLSESSQVSMVSGQPHQHRLPPGEISGPRRLTDKCQRELFVCVLHILSTVSEDHLTTLLHSLTVQERIHFLYMLSYAIQHLRYRGKKCIQQYDHISRSGVGRAGFGGSSSAFHSGGRRSGAPLLRPASIPAAVVHLNSDGQSGNDQEETSKVLMEANLATEAGLIILDLLNTFALVFKPQLESCKPSDAVFTGLLEVYVALLTNNPSECLLRHTFASLRVFVKRFAKVLFSESTDILNSICLTTLRCVNQLLPSIEIPLGLRNHSLVSASSAQSSNMKSSLIHSTPSESVSRSQSGFSNSGESGSFPSDPIATIRMEACGLLYKLWKSSYENYGQSGFHRVHLQTIISVSKLVSEIQPGFEATLNLLHTLVETDMHRSGMDTAVVGKFWSNHETRTIFQDNVSDLIRRVRTVLTATAEMRQHNDDHERLIDLQYCLAKSYSSNPALRRTWLEELAKLHMSSKSLAELAMAKLHTAALMAEYLKRRGTLDREFPQGCEAFSAISSNISEEENGLGTDSALLEIPYTQDDLLLDINESAVTLEAAGLYEAIRPVYALVTPIYEARQDYTALAQVYRHIGRAYEAIGHAEANKHRLFAAYFRVTFYGQLFESLANKSFIYRTSACQKLGGMCTDLLALYRKKYGQDKVDLLTDYAYQREKADPNKAYIQVTYVEPYKTLDHPGRMLTSYEVHHDVSQFMFETPFLLQPGMTTTASLLVAGPKHSDDLTQQWKRRTVLTTAGTFPHLRRRLEVANVTETDLCPIDAAIDAIQCKNRELMTHVYATSLTKPTVSIDISNGNGDRSAQQHRISVAAIGLHSPITGGEIWHNSTPNLNVQPIPLLMDMQLQGALLPTVNVGPMAYAEAFLKAENQVLYPRDKVARLRELFFEFLTVCFVLLTRYHRLMSSVYEAKYIAMRESLDRYRVDLSNLLKEEIVINDEKMVIGPKSVKMDDSVYDTPAAMETSMMKEPNIG